MWAWTTSRATSSPRPRRTGRPHRGVVAETEQTGFHFVDEAAPPKALKSLATEIAAARSWIFHGGATFASRSHSIAELCQLLADSGCIAVTGGLEVASDRLLKLMKKGVSVEQVARVTRAFSDAGILVHAYLMYGFPTQTVQDTVDALEYVRQLFAAGCIQSGFFHRFTCTVHSPVGKHPEQYGVTLVAAAHAYVCEQRHQFHGSRPASTTTFSAGLKKALYNYMHGIGLEDDVRSWFSGGVPHRHRAARVYSPSTGGSSLALSVWTFEYKNH